MESKNNNVKTSHLSEDELLSHSLMYQVVFLLRTIASQCHMLVPQRLNAIIKRWVGHGLCEVTALPSKLSCPITGKTFLNKDVYKDHYQKNKKQIKKEKKKNKGKKPAPPTDLPKFPDVDWTAFLKADNHHKNVIEEVQKSRVESTIWHFSTGALKRIDMDVRPEHCARYASYSGKDIFDVAGRNIREVICHGTKYDQLMALIAWYAVGETSKHNGWCTGLQQKPSVREIRACSIGDTEYNHPVETKAWPVMGNMWGQCHINALRLLLSEGKGFVCVGYHAVRVPCLSFYTIMLEAHSVYYDGKTYWDATNTGDEMTSDTGLFIPLVMIDKDGNQTNTNNRYRTKHSFVKCQILKSYNDQIPITREVVRLNSKMQQYDGSTDNSVMMEIAEKRDKMNTKLKRETEFFYKAMLEFDDVAEIRYMCRDMCDQAPWLNNPMLIDSTPGMMGRPGLTPISLMNVSVRPSPVHGRGLFADKSFKAGNVAFQEHSEGGTLISAPAHISLTELGGVQNNCSFVWSLLMGGHAVNGWIANLCTNPRIVEHMTPKDHELIEYLVDAQTEGRSPEQIEMFRGRLMECFNRLECNQFTVDVPGSVPPLNVMTYVGDKCSKLNHSDEPNCRMQSKFIGTELMFVQAIALRDIMPGEELFIDYGDEYKQKMFEEKKEEEEEVKEVDTLPTIPISRAEEVAARLGGGLNVAAVASIAMEEWCPHCQSLEHPMTKCPKYKYGEYHLNIFNRAKANKNHVSNGRSGDDHKRQELEQTSEATGNNQIAFKEVVSRAFDEARAYGLECTLRRIILRTRNHLDNRELQKVEYMYISSEVNKETATSELKGIVTDVLKCPSGPDPNLFNLPDICGCVCAFINRELNAEEIQLVDQMMHLYKRLKCLKSGENEKVILEMGITRIQEATKALEERRAQSSSNRTALRNQLNICLANRGMPTLDEEEEPAKKRKRYSNAVPRKSGPAKVKIPNTYALKWEDEKDKMLVEHNQKKLIAFFTVWVQLLEYADKEEEAEEIENLAHAMGDKMVMSPVNWGLAERMAEELMEEKKNGEQLWSWASDDFVSSLSGKALYASYENTFVESPDPKRHWEKWEAIAQHENLVDTRIKELRQNWDSDEQKACYEEVIEAENESHPEWRKEIDEDERVIKARQEYTLLNGQTLHLENAVKLIGLMRIWARILGLPEKTVDVTLSIKIRDMEMAMGFTDAHRTRAIGIADEAFDNISGGVKMMNFVEREEIFLRLGTYYDTFMNISDDAVENFITDYTNNFRMCRLYEWMIVILRQEITQNFCCETEKESFADRIKELDEQDSEWRDRVNGDWRIKSARGETDDPE